MRISSSLQTQNAVRKQDDVCCEPGGPGSDACPSPIVGRLTAKTPGLSMYVGQAWMPAGGTDNHVLQSMAADPPSASTADRLLTQTIGTTKSAVPLPKFLLLLADVCSCVVINTCRCRCTACLRRGVGSTPDVDGGSGSAPDPLTLRLTQQEPE